MRYTDRVEQDQSLSRIFPRPRAAMIGLLAVMTALWVVMAAVAKWGESTTLFELLVGMPDRLFSEPWRIFTNPFVHDYRGLGHVAMNLVFLYFMASQLEEKWTKVRFIGTLVGAAWIASFVELLVERFVPWFRTHEMVFGSAAMVNAACVAWAVQLRGAKVRLYGALPMNATAILVLIIVMNVISVLRGGGFEGYTTPFVAMIAGFALSDMSPVRRLYLQTRYKRLAQESARLRIAREGRAAREELGGTAGRPALRVIPGGGGKKPDRSMMN